MHIAITIDTEEDNWGNYLDNSFAIENIKKIPVLQDIFNEFKIIPTYLVTYPVATKRDSVRILNDILQQGKCEIGMHCHPWSTPPFEEERNSHNSMLCNLPYELQKKKMSELHEAIERNLGIKGRAFRAGRFGFNGTVSRVIRDLGYTVDTSVSPFINWSESDGPDFSKVTPEFYRFRAPEIFTKINEGELMEIPLTIGYLQNNFKLCGEVERLLGLRLLKIFRGKGILAAMKLLNKVQLSPEASDSNEMIELTKVLARKKFRIINMFFHSTSLKAGLSFMVKSKEEEIRFFRRLRKYLAFMGEAGIRPIKLSEVDEIMDGDKS